VIGVPIVSRQGRLSASHQRHQKAPRARAYFCHALATVKGLLVAKPTEVIACAKYIGKDEGRPSRTFGGPLSS
jgi:hypothetical protein